LLLIVELEVQKYLEQEAKSKEEKINRLLAFKDQIKKGEEMESYSSRAVRLK